jgi:amidohydrolase
LDKLILASFGQQPSTLHTRGFVNLIENARSLATELIEIRRDLHRHPELSFQEVRTAEIASREMEALGFSVRTGIGRTGVIAELHNGEGPLIALRADMDALPIQEANKHDFVSENPGVMHACGHDGHVAGMIGAARILAEAKSAERLPSGSIRFIFQPSEEATDDEGMSGAMRMVEEGVMEGVDAVVGLHLGAPLPVGKLFFASGPIMAGAAEIHIDVHGKSSHAGMPEGGVDALVLAARGIVATQDAAPERRSPLEDGIISFGQIAGGTATNVLADHVVIHGTMRFFSEETRRRLRRRLDEAFGALEAFGAKVEIDVETGILPVINDERVTECVRSAAVELVGEDDVLPIQPMTLAEDFSFLAHEAPGTFFWVGAALPRPRMHHEADFDIDESALPIGAATLAGGAIRLLEEMA